MKTPKFVLAFAKRKIALSEKEERWDNGGKK
jgi:hypothetical protein